MKTKTETMHGIPDNMVKDIVALIKANPHYVSHEVIHEADGTNTIAATYKVDDDLAVSDSENRVAALKHGRLRKGNL